MDGRKEARKGGREEIGKKWGAETEYRANKKINKNKNKMRQ